MAVFSFNGLATGIDTGSIVDELVKIRRRPLDFEILNRAERQETRDAFGDLESKLLAVRTALTNLRTPQDVQTKTATSSDTDVLTATAGTGAANGSTTVTVKTLAAASRATAATGLADTSGTVAAGAGTFEFTVGGGDPQTVNLTATTTLQELVDGINALNAGVTASAINVGTPGAASYKLQIVANSTGTTSNLAILNDDTILGVTAADGSNAVFTVTGFTEDIERASNAVADVIPGVTLTLKQSGGSAEVIVSDDAAAVEGKVKAFVDAFNEVVTFVNERSRINRVNDETSDVGALAANPTVRGVLDRLRETIRTSIEDATGGVTTLSQIGIATQQDGTLAFDSAKFQSEFAQSPLGVGELFGGVGNGDGVGDLLHNTITDLTRAGGLLSNVQDNLDDALRRTDDTIETGERAIEAFRADLEARFVALETTVNTIQSQGDFLLQQLVSVRNLVPRNSGS